MIEHSYARHLYNSVEVYLFLIFIWHGSNLLRQICLINLFGETAKLLLLGALIFFYTLFVLLLYFLNDYSIRLLYFEIFKLNRGEVIERIWFTFLLSFLALDYPIGLCWWRYHSCRSQPYLCLQQEIKLFVSLTKWQEKNSTRKTYWFSSGMCMFNFYNSLLFLVNSYCY